MSRRIGVLINPTSGKGRAGRLAPQVLTRLQTLDDEIVPIQAASAEQADVLLREELAAGLDVLAALGGDGTVHQALQHVVGTDTALAILPFGTGNDAARTLGVPRDDPLAAVDVVLRGETRRVDVGVVETADGERRHFLCVLSTGFDSMCNVRANNMTWPRGEARYVLAMLAELRTFRPLPYKLEVDGQVEEREAMLMAIGNGRSYGGGMHICPTADITDGLLTMVQIDAISRFELIKTFPKIYPGTHVDHPRIQVREFKVAHLDAPGQIACADGEVVGPLPIRVEVAPAALRVMVADNQ